MDPQQNPSDSVLNQLSVGSVVGSSPVPTQTLQPSKPVVPVGLGLQAALGSTLQSMPTPSSSLPPAGEMGGQIPSVAQSPVLPPPTSLPADSSQKRNIFFSLVGVIILVALAAGWYFWQSRQASLEAEANQKLVQQNVKKTTKPVVENQAVEAPELPQDLLPPPTSTGDKGVDEYYSRFSSNLFTLTDFYTYLDSRFVSEPDFAYIVRNEFGQNTSNGLVKVKKLPSATVVWASLPAIASLQKPNTQYSVVAIPLKKDEILTKTMLLQRAMSIGDLTLAKNSSGDETYTTVKVDAKMDLLSTGSEWMVGVAVKSGESAQYSDILYYGYPAQPVKASDGSYSYEIIPEKK